MSQIKYAVFNISYDATTDHGETIYVAGTFTRPAWLLQEMPRTTRQGGAICYSKKIMADPSKEHQYRLKLGVEGAWIVDESKPIVTSVLGTKSNILQAPSGASTQERQKNDRKSRDSSAEADAPLCDHERVGSYDLPDENPMPASPEQARRDSQGNERRTISLKDPRIEDFPLEKDAIMGTLRRIRSSHSDSGVVIEDGPGQADGRRSSLDSDEGSVTSSGQLSPTSVRRRENRLSSGSGGRNKSVISLGAIAEEPGARRPAGGSSDSVQEENDPTSETGEEGDGLAMRSSKS